MKGVRHSCPGWPKVTAHRLALVQFGSCQSLVLWSQRSLGSPAEASLNSLALPVTLALEFLICSGLVVCGLLMHKYAVFFSGM